MSASKFHLPSSDNAHLRLKSLVNVDSMRLNCDSEQQSRASTPERVRMAMRAARDATQPGMTTTLGAVQPMNYDYSLSPKHPSVNSDLVDSYNWREKQF